MKSKIWFFVSLLMVLTMTVLVYAQITTPSGIAEESATTVAGCLYNQTAVATFCAVAGDKMYVAMGTGTFLPIYTGPAPVTVQMAPGIPVGNVVVAAGPNALADGGKMPTVPPSPNQFSCPTGTAGSTGLSGSNCLFLTK